MRQWRLIYDSPTNGSANMARDEAILAAVSAGDSPPTLRFYDWSPPCLSLGYGQKATDADTARLEAAGWQLVRRPTGGRAILHIDELTYSIAVPESHPIAAGGIVESYRRISAALLAGLQALGAQADAQPRAAGHRAAGPVCFEIASHYEITVGGRKLVGSAQVRRKGGVLQHGSIPLTGDVARICDALAYPDEVTREAAKQTVRARATTLAAALGDNAPTWRQAADAIAAAFGAVFAVEMIRDAEG